MTSMHLCELPKSMSERRLVAILIADVQGYGRLMHENETATIRIRIGNSHGLFHSPRRLCPPAACQPPPRARAPRQAAAGRAACRGHGQDDSLGTGRRRGLPGADAKR